MNFSDLSIKEIHNGLKSKKFSCRELTDFYLSKIEEWNPKINAYLWIFFDQARYLAQEIDELIAQEKEIHLLSGIPCAIKDNIAIRGQKASAGSKILKNYIAPYDAFVIEKLKSKNSVILGKTNLDEFAVGSSGEHSAYGPTKNPLDHKLVPGGSSSGSAAAVSQKMCVFSLGSDTGGSVRQPASFCGVVGLKPTYGAVSRHGLIAMASSLDQIGPIAKTVEDAEIVFEAIRGQDKMDSTSFEKKEEDFEKKLQAEKFKIGIVKEGMGEGIDNEVLASFKKTIENIRKEGVSLEEISLPHLHYGLACYYILMTAEVSSNLARYDGIKYGQSKKDAKNLLDIYFETRKEFFGPEVKRRIMLGTYCLSSGYYESYYLKAQRTRTKIVEDFKSAFKKVDLLLMPTSSTLPFRLGERIDNPLSMYLADLLTVPVNLSGLPAISIPFKDKKKFPIGIQLIAPAFGEKKIFEFGKFFEKICQSKTT